MSSFNLGGVTKVLLSLLGSFGDWRFGYVLGGFSVQGLGFRV